MFLLECETSSDTEGMIFQAGDIIQRQGGVSMNALVGTNHEGRIIAAPTH